MTEQMPQKVKREKGPTNSPRNSSPKKYCRKHPKYFVKYRILAKKVSFFFCFSSKVFSKLLQNISWYRSGIKCEEECAFCIFFFVISIHI